MGSTNRAEYQRPSNSLALTSRGPAVAATVRAKAATTFRQSDATRTRQTATAQWMAGQVMVPTMRPRLYVAPIAAAHRRARVNSRDSAPCKAVRRVFISVEFWIPQGGAFGLLAGVVGNWWCWPSVRAGRINITQSGVNWVYPGKGLSWGHS